MHLEVLSRLSMLLMDDEFRTNLLDAADVTEFLVHIDEAERKKFPEEYGEEKQEQDQDQPEEGYRVLAVTACPTGIAHTYMAAESLENKAKEMGISIKVETNGSGGAKNVLTPEEIAQCECIIIAADKFGMGNPFSRFLKQVGDISFGMMFPILAGYIAYSIADVPALAVGVVGGYLAKVGNSFANITGEGAVSGGFLAALLAGFAAGYLVLLIQKAASFLPKSLEGIKPVLIYPLSGILLIGVFMFAVNPAMAALNNAIIGFLNSMGGSSKVLLGCIVGAMMSIDMGGPCNKAAYVFATASVASGNYEVMAAVMLGGMIPPLAVALASTVFKNKFTEEERKSGIANYVMGLCFITEGVIPFAAADPLRVIPSCVAGSAVAGGLSMLFGCTLRAPHGGIFVFPVVGNVLGYVIALAAGSLVGMLLLGILKKNKAQTE